MKTATSVKARIKNRADKEKRNVQDMFILYVLERVLYRLSLSPYKDNFVLKGGCLLYGVFNEQYARTTTDIDLLGIRISNESEYMKKIFADVLSVECDDAIRFDINSLSARNITEFKEYHGVNVSVIAYLDRTRVPVNIDIGYNDVIYPREQVMEYPTILDDEPPILNAYSLESIIAEKFEAIVSLGVVNSRYKDFYDIYTLAHRFDFSGKELLEAIIETFEHRKTTLEKIAAFEEGFADDAYRKGRWKGFIKTKRADTDLSLDETIAFIRTFLEPIVTAINNGKRFDKLWNHSNASWD